MLQQKDVKEKPGSKNPKEDEPVPFTSVTKVVSQRYSKFRKLLSDLTALNNEYAGSGSTTNVCDCSTVHNPTQTSQFKEF